MWWLLEGIEPSFDACLSPGGRFTRAAEERNGRKNDLLEPGYEGRGMRLSEFIPVFLSSRSLSVPLHMPTCHMTLFSVTYFVYTLLLHPFIPPTTIVRHNCNKNPVTNPDIRSDTIPDILFAPLWCIAEYKVNRQDKTRQDKR